MKRNKFTQRSSESKKAKPNLSILKPTLPNAGSKGIFNKGKSDESEPKSKG